MNRLCHALNACAKTSTSPNTLRISSVHHRTQTPSKTSAKQTAPPPRTQPSSPPGQLLRHHLGDVYLHREGAHAGHALGGPHEERAAWVLRQQQQRLRLLPRDPVEVPAADGAGEESQRSMGGSWRYDGFLADIAHRSAALFSRQSTQRIISRTVSHATKQLKLPVHQLLHSYIVVQKKKPN